MDFIYETWISFLSLIKTFTIFDLVDIIVVSFLIYHVIKLVRDTRAEQLVKGILLLIVTFAFASQFNLRMLSSILNYFFQFGMIALLIVFQPELRRAIENLGRSKISKHLTLNSSLNEKEIINEQIKNCIDETVDAAIMFQRMKTGALIVFERETKLGEIISTGTVIDAKPSCRLIANIFFNKSPLHDGAMIIRQGMVYAAGCILPLTKNKAIGFDVGTRHRAALGISENSDAFTIVVSEETGNISVAINGKLRRDFTEETLKIELEKALLIEKTNNESHKQFFSSFVKNINKKDKD